MFNGKGYYVKNDIAFEIRNCKSNSKNTKIKKLDTKSTQCIEKMTKNESNKIKAKKNVKENQNGYKNRIVNGVEKNNIYRTSTHKIFKIFKKRSNYEKEIDIHKLAAENKVAPKLFEIFCGEYMYYNPEVNKQTKIYIISMEEMQFTLREFMKKKVPVTDKLEVQNQCYKLVKKMNELGIKHRDLHDENIMINYSRKNNKTQLKVRIIDFGYSDINYEPVPNLQNNILYTPYRQRFPYPFSGNIHRSNSKNLNIIFGITKSNNNMSPNTPKQENKISMKRNNN